MSASTNPIIRSLPRQYFAGGGAEALALLEQCAALHRQHVAKLDELLRQLGADCLSKFGDGTLHAACYLHEKGEPSREMPGMRCVLREPTQDGQVLHFYQPDKATAEGLVIARKAREIGPFNSSDWLLDRIDGQRCRLSPDPDSPTGLNLNYSMAFRSGDQLVATLPVVPDQPFRPPAWLKHIDRAHFDALVRASQRQALPTIH